MQKIKKLLILTLFIVLINYNVVQASDNNIDNTQIMEEQQKDLGIEEFIDLSNKYTKDSLREININEIFNSALTGKIENVNIFKIIFRLLGKEFKDCISGIRNSFNNNYYT